MSEPREEEVGTVEAPIPAKGDRKDPDLGKAVGQPEPEKQPANEIVVGQSIENPKTAVRDEEFVADPYGGSKADVEEIEPIDTRGEDDSA